MKYLFIICLFLACNPVKLVQKQIAKNAETKAQLAVLCADQFPVTETQRFIPGYIDTAAIQQAIIRICSENKLITVPPLQQPDTVIRYLKKIFPPDTLLIIRKDTALMQSFQYQITTLRNTVAEKDKSISALNATLAAVSKEKKVYLYILLLVALAIGAYAGFKIYTAFSIKKI